VIGGERVGAVLVAAGRSTRMGFDKLWADLGGRPVLAWSLALLANCPEIDRFVAVCNADAVGAVADLATTVSSCLHTEVVAGGERRRDSVEAGLLALAGCTWVLVHDAARPFLTEAVIYRGLQEMATTGACVAALPACDTIKRVVAGSVIETPPREQLWTVQTPQVFRREIVLAALAATDDDATDEAGLVERAGGTVRVFEGDVANFKITTPGDLEIARAILAHREASASMHP
jgi:2-C-methyl-D-erythritol 4-phosphate cytidylyltransferase